ncbi:MAG: hypothetical protein JW737_03800 [Acidobacteria bacterium]|nr:hypothetical protein [Acidobacteriota bacterium]
MNTLYSHKQIGHVIIWGLIAGLVLVVVIMLKTEFSLITIIISIALAIFLYLFHSLTIEINEQDLIFFFGHGFWKKRILIAEIEKAEVVKNRWYYGWGIRLIQNGWLYNVSGLQAVEIQVKNGKTVRIGSDEPERVKEVLEELKYS